MGRKPANTVVIERREIGPTPQRIAKADSHYAVGGDAQTGRVYHFHDDTLNRLYSRLIKSAGRANEEELRREYIALQRLKHHWHHSGQQPAMGSVDLNRVFASDPGSMSGMAKSERQYHHREQYRAARKKLEETPIPQTMLGGRVLKEVNYGHKLSIVVDVSVCHERSLVDAGYAIGYESEDRAGQAATRMLRHAGQILSGMWGIG